MGNKFKIIKKFVRGKNNGKRAEEVITLESADDIYSFLWDMTNLFDKNRCDFVIEWYSVIG